MIRFLKQCRVKRLQGNLDNLSVILDWLLGTNKELVIRTAKNKYLHTKVKLNFKLNAGLEL